MDTFYAFAWVIIVLCRCGFHGREVLTLWGSRIWNKYREEGKGTQCVCLWDNNHTYPIVVVDMKGDTWPLVLAGNKNESFGLASAYEGLLSIRQPPLYHRRCVCRNLMTTAPFPSTVTVWIHTYMSLCTWQGNQSFFSSFDVARLVMMEQQQQQWRCWRSSAESNGDTTGAVLFVV